MIEQNSPKQKFFPWLITADVIAIVAILLLYFGDNSTPTSGEQIAAIAGVIIAGLFVFVPAFIEMLRTPEPPPSLPEIEKLFKRQYENQRILQEDVRSAADTILKRLAGIESRLNESQTVANDLQPALGEIADQIAALTTLTGEDGEVARLRTAIEEIQSQLDQFADALRALESKNTADAPEPDGALPPSLMAKAFAAGTENSAIGRLIENSRPATTGETPSEQTALYEDAEDIDPPAPVIHAGNARQGTMPAEDEIWSFAEDMASGETPTQPDLLDELELSQAEPPSPQPAKNETSIFVTAMIGLGSKPYIRGTGPGLSAESGIPMEHVAVGKWCWRAPDSTLPAKISIWKDDRIRAGGEDIELRPGSATEVTLVFPEEEQPAF